MKIKKSLVDGLPLAWAETGRLSPFPHDLGLSATAQTTF
jgi:hypothetical protein